MSGALIGPWCARCELKRATWADRLCPTCDAETWIEFEREIDDLGRRLTSTPKSITHHAVCLECGWTMPADDEAEAEILLEVHRIVKLNDEMQGGA